MTDVPIKNATNEKDLPEPIKIELSNGISFGFQAAVGFWFFTLILAIIILIILGASGVFIPKI